MTYGGVDEAITSKKTTIRLDGTGPEKISTAEQNLNTIGLYRGNKEHDRSFISAEINQRKDKNL